MLDSILQRSAVTLSDEFARDGFVAIRDAFEATAIADINAEVDRVIHDVVPTLPADQVFYEVKGDPGSLKQIINLHRADPYFATLMRDGPVRRLAELLLNGPVTVENMQFFNKPPATAARGDGKPTPPHQDGYYFHLTPCLAVTGWLALESVDEENGCVHYVRGSHIPGAFRPHGRTGTLGFSNGITDWGSADDLAADVACPAAPGTLMMHGAHTIHWAGPNRSTTRTRRALGFIYYGARARPDRAAAAIYRDTLAAQLAAAGRI